MHKRTLWFLIVLVACKRHPAGSEATAGSSVGSAEHAAAPPAAPEPAPAPAPAPVPKDLPIDPSKPPPEASLSTSAALKLDRPAMIVVDGRADLYSSGMAAADEPRGGRLPALLTLAAGGGEISFSKVKGASGCIGDDATPADGGDCVSRDTDIGPADGISGIVNHAHSMFLAGVFLGAARSTEAPSRLDFSPGAIGEAFPELSPRIAQTFFIGDGLTPTGATQRFIIPAGATRLFLGYCDAPYFQGTPGAYQDNTGGLHVTATQKK